MTSTEDESQGISQDMSEDPDGAEIKISRLSSASGFSSAARGTKGKKVLKRKKKMDGAKEATTKGCATPGEPSKDKTG